MDIGKLPREPYPQPDQFADSTPEHVSEFLQLIEFRGIYGGLRFCLAHGIMEDWNTDIKGTISFNTFIFKKEISIIHYPIHSNPIIPWPIPYRQNLYYVAYSFFRITLDRFHKSSRGRAGHHFYYSNIPIVSEAN